MLEQGCEGIGIYWCLIEMLYEQGGSLPLSDLPLYAKSLNTTLEKLNHTLEVPNLFKKNSTRFYSLSQKKRLQQVKNRSEKARNSALQRWDANALPTQCERNAIKYSKVNKRKGEYNTQPKRTHLDCVLLTDNEHQQLIASLGSYNTKAYIEKLNAYLGSTGKRYKSHYHTIRCWALKDGVMKAVPAAEPKRFIEEDKKKIAELESEREDVERLMHGGARA